MSVVDRDESTEADAPAPEPLPDEGWDRPVDDPPRDDSVISLAVDVGVVSACVLFVFWQLHPGLILSATTPTGGDMGAHVWAFGYLRDTLLPSGQVTGWTPDWYAGFPAFQFYMVVPFLAMVVLNAGGTGVGAVVAAMASTAAIGRVAGVPTRSLWMPPVAVGFVVGVVGFLTGDRVQGFGSIGETHFAPGFQFGLMVALVAAALVAGYSGRSPDRRWVRRGLVSLAVVIALVGIALPYGVAFKLVAIAGVCAMPACAYAFGRLAGLSQPTPSLLAVTVLAFEFDTNFTIYGGNIPSTMAGEFAFSISLALAILYLGLLIRGLRTGAGRATAAGVLALVGLCHLLPAFFALLATAVLLLVHVVDERNEERSRYAAFGAAIAGGAVVVAGVLAVVLDLFTPAPVIVVGVAALVIVALVWNLARGEGPVAGRPPDADEGDHLLGADDALDAETLDEFDQNASHTPAGAGLPVLSRTWWLASTGVVAGLLASFWVLPFYWKRTYLNDMGWEKIAVHRDGVKIWDWFTDQVATRLVPTANSDFVDHDPTDLRLWAVLAIVGALLSIVFRNRVGTGLVIIATVLALAFVYAPQGRLWNARILPFWYLVVYLLAAVGIGEIVRSIAAVATTRPDRPSRSLLWIAPPVVLVVFGLFLAAQLRNLPVLGGQAEDGTYQVGIGPATVDVNGSNISRSWARWNFVGYEGKDLYPEYRAVVDTMATLSQTRGCGRAMWEYSSELNSYGTPMALMLLPHWTDGCIGSMEGLYFEASSTTPFHFLMQSELSTSPSRAQRDMPYRDFDIDAGVGHMQLLGVRYYMTYTPQATEAARGHQDLDEIVSSQHWTVFEVADAPLVEGLAFEPAVTTAGEKQDEWLCSSMDESDRCSGVALDWFQDAEGWDIALAASGPDEWQRLDPGGTPQARPVPEAVVSDVETDDDRISFTVDTVGSPVLVKASYFPNWSVSGAEGPYRVAPNLMVVVPTDNEVTLTYDRTAIDWLAIALSLAGVAALIVFWRRGAVTVPPLRDDTVA